MSIKLYGNSQSEKSFMQNMMKERRQKNLMNLLLAFIMLSTEGEVGGSYTYRAFHVQFFGRK